MAKIGTLHTGEPIEKATRVIREWLDRLSVNGLSIHTAHDARQNIAVLRFSYLGKNYEFKSTQQQNCRLNMHAIAKVMEAKVRAHLMQIEPFEKAMKAYLQLEATPEAMRQGSAYVPESQEDATIQDYALLGANQLMSNEELTKCYKKAAKTWHPDLAGSQESKVVFEQKFSEINTAWQRIQKARRL